MDNKGLAAGFGDRLRAERLRLHLSQEQLAGKLGVKQQTIFQYEKGHTSPTLKFVYRLRAFEFNLPYLLFGNELLAPKPSDYPPHILKLVSDMVTSIEKNFGGGSFSNETRLRMFLILLSRYVEQPTEVSLTDVQALELLMGN